MTRAWGVRRPDGSLAAQTHDTEQRAGSLAYYIGDGATAVEVTIREAGACEWRETLESDYTVWETGCGEAHMFTTDGPRENRHRFCCYCGRTLEVTDD